MTTLTPADVLALPRLVSPRGVVHAGWTEGIVSETDRAEVLPVALERLAAERTGWAACACATCAQWTAAIDALAAILPSRIARGVETYGEPLHTLSPVKAADEALPEVADALLYGVLAKMRGDDVAPLAALLRAAAAAVEG